MRKPGGCQLFPLLEQFAQLELDPLLRALSHRSLISKTPCDNGCFSKLTISYFSGFAWMGEQMWKPFFSSVMLNQLGELLEKKVFENLFFWPGWRRGLHRALKEIVVEDGMEEKKSWIRRRMERVQRREEAKNFKQIVWEKKMQWIGKIVEEERNIGQWFTRDVFQRVTKIPIQDWSRDSSWFGGRGLGIAIRCKFMNPPKRS